MGVSGDPRWFVRHAGWALATVFCLLMPLVVVAQKPPAPKRRPALRVQSQAGGSLSLELVSAPGGVSLSSAGAIASLDLGAVSYAAGSRAPNVSLRRLSHSFVLVTTFGLRVRDDAGRYSSALLTAFTGPVQSPYMVRVDGVTLQSAPQILAARLPLGTVTQHRLEIEVPVSVTERTPSPPPVIRFQVVPN